MALFRGLSSVLPIKIFVSVVLIVLVTIWVKSFFDYNDSEIFDKKLNQLNHLYYQLDTKKPVVFDIFDHMQSMRLSVVPLVNKDQLKQLPPLLHFSITIKLLNRQHQLIFEKNYHFSEDSNVDAIQFATQSMHSNFNHLQPIPPNTINLPKVGSTQSGICEVYVHDKDSSISMVGVQLHSEIESNVAPSVNWAGMHPVRRALMETNNIYGANHLSDTEKANAVKFKYINIPPLGLLKKDIKPIIITINYNIQKTYISPFIALGSDGFLVTKNKALIAPLPQASNQIRLHFFSIGDKEAASTHKAIHITLALYHHYATEPDIKTIVINKLPSQTDVILPQSLLSMTADQPVFIYPQIKEHEQYKNLVTPYKVNIYQLSFSKPVQYNLSPKNNQPTPLRVDITTLHDNPVKSHYVKYQFIDNNNHIVHQGELATIDEKTTLHQLSPFEDTTVREPISYFFLLPHNTKKIIFYGDSGSFVTAYQRPYLLPIRRQLFVDFYEPIDSNKIVPDWFGLQPENEKILWQNGRVAEMRIQKTLPEYEDYLLNYQYFSERIMPVHYESQLLALTMIRLNKNIVADNDIYQPIAANKKLILHFQSGYQEAKIQPQLIVVPHEIKNETSSHLLDMRIGQQKEQIKLSPISSRYTLPFIFPKKHTAYFGTANQTQLFMNYLSPREPLYRLSFLFSLDPSLIFQVNHENQTDRFITKVYYSKNTKQPINILVHITPLRKPGYVPTLEYTYPIQEITLGKSEFLPAIAIDNQQSLSGGEAFSIVLAPDLPSGQIKINLQSNKKSSVYANILFLNKTKKTYVQQNIERR